MTPILSVKECLVFGWESFKKHPWLYVKVGIVLFALQMAINLVSSWVNVGNAAMTGTNLIPVMILSLVVTIITVYIGITVNNMGVFTFYLKAHDDPSSAHLRDLYRPHPFWSYFLMSILIGLSVLVGLILLVIPGLIVALAFSLAPYLMLEHKFRAVDAIKESRRMTKGNRGKLLLLVLAIVAINLVGAILLLVGLLVSVPVSTLAFVHAYRILSDKAILPVAA